MAKCSLLFLVAIPAVLGLLVPSCMGDNILHSGETLRTEQSLVHRGYRLTMQTDCNLVLYDDAGRATWMSGTNGRGSNCRAAMQSDGNFIVYTGSSNAVWASNTDRGIANYVLILQKDHNLVIYGPAIWATLKGPHAVVVASNATDTNVPVVVAEAADDGLGIRKIAMVTEN